MGMMCNVVVAGFEEADEIGESSRPVEEWKGFEAGGLDQAKFAMLHALLSGQYFDEAQRDLVLVYAASDEGPWLLRFPAASVKRLAGMDEEALEAVGAELAATEEFEAEGWPAEEVQKIVVQMADLAGAAVAQGKAMFVWMMDSSS